MHNTHIYIYIHTHREGIGNGTNGVSTTGVTAIFMCFGQKDLTYLYIPKSVRAYLFPQSVKIHYFCSGPISVDPICPQPTGEAVRDAFQQSPAGQRKRGNGF